MQLIMNKWFAPLLAMFIVLTMSTLRMYMYLDGVLKRYEQSFYIDTSDYYTYWTFHTRELQELIDSLDGKHKELNKREEDLTNLQTRLDNEKKELTEEKMQLEAMRNGLSDVIVQAKDDEMANIKNLASTYAAMNADAVVGILNEMDDNTVVKVLAQMKSDTIGPIFEAMTKVPGQESQMAARIAKLSEKIRLYKQAKTAGQ